MGSTSYSFNSRSARAESEGYFSKSVNDTFKQNRLRQIHKEMDPKGVEIRESRDSEVHPNSVPIILSLDVTGSMGRIPEFLVKDGLPKMMANIIQRGVPDPQVLFLAVGDVTCDDAPLQVGQFESGDEELDLWLTRTWLESGGGGNFGESYSLAWYFASNHTVTDSFEKRGHKGFVFTIGDEPCLTPITPSAIEGIMGKRTQASLTDKELLAAAQEKYEVFHLHVMEGTAGTRSLNYWKELLGQNCIEVNDHRKISDIIGEIVVSRSLENSKQGGGQFFANAPSVPTSGVKIETKVEGIIL